MPTDSPIVRVDRPLVGLLALTAVSGIVDAVSLLGLGHVFTANMTGNVVFLAFAAVGTPGVSAARSLTSLAAFLGGAAIGGYLARESAGPTRRHWLRLYAAWEAALLFAAAITLIALDGDRTALEARQYGAIALLALAMGLRTATVRQLVVPDLAPTTMITMTLTGLVADLSLAGSSISHSLRRMASIASLFGGAVLGALLLRWGPTVPLIVASVCVLVAAAYVVPPATRRADPIVR
jgi:uncharacterized membrane protein YoaK (UPF0700 family)